MSKFVGIIFSVVGMAIGGYFFGPAGAAIGGGIGGMIGGVLQATVFAPSPPHMPSMEPGQLETPKPNDLQMMSYAENAPIPYLCGTKLMAPQIIQVFDKWTVPVKQYQTYTVQELDADGKDADVETHTRTQEVIVAYDYFVRALLGLVQGLNGNCRIGEIYVNGKLNTALQLTLKNGDEDDVSWLWNEYNYDNPQKYKDLFYAELDGSVGRNIFMMPSLQVSVTRTPGSDEYDFLATTLPENNNQKGAWVNVISTSIGCFNNSEVWKLVDYYKDKWEPLNALTYNKWPFNKDYQPYDTNPESKTDFSASIKEVKDFIGGTDNVIGLTFVAPWFWDLADDSFVPMHAFELIPVTLVIPKYEEIMGFTIQVGTETKNTEIMKLKVKPVNAGGVEYHTGVVRQGEDTVVSYETRFPEGCTDYNPTVGGVQFLNQYGEPQIKQIYFDSDGIPCYGGTPADDGLIQGIQYAISQGFEFSFYSFMEVADPPGEKPWRGNLLPEHKTIGELLTQVKSQCLYYANLLINNNLKPKRFIACSELVKINQQKTYASPHRSDVRTYTDAHGTFHFTSIPYLMDIVEEVRNKFSDAGWGDVLVGYSADWSEVNGFKDDDGYWWRPLDDLFAFQDEVFIDAYYGVTEHHTLAYQDYYDGWTKGRDWDYYITDYDDWKDDVGGTAPITDPAFAAKNLKYWVSHNHYNYNPDGSQNSQTDWVPNSKKIYFAEVGCPSIDSGATEPNLFFDPKAVQGGLPKGTTLTVCNTVQLFYYKSIVDNAHDGNLPLREFSLWNIDSRPLFTLMGSGRSFWDDGYRIPVGHWMKYPYPDPVSDIVVNDFEQRRNISLNINTSAISSAFQQARSDGWYWNVYIDNPVPFQELLKTLSKQMPILFYVDDGQLTAKYIKPDDDGALYNVKDYPVNVQQDGTGYFIDEPFDHVIHSGKRYEISGGYIQDWPYTTGSYNVDSSNVIEGTLDIMDGIKTNIRASVTYFDTTNFENKGLKTRVETYEVMIGSNLNWEDSRLNQSIAPDGLVARMMARYIAASTVYNRNTFKLQSWERFHVGDRVRIITNLKDSYYRVMNLQVDESGLLNYSGYEESQPFHDILSQQISPVDYPEAPPAPSPTLTLAYFANSFDKWYVSADYGPDIAWVMVTATFGDGNQSSFFVTQISTSTSLSLDDETMVRIEGYETGYYITDNKELIALAPGLYGTYLQRGYDGTRIKDSSQQLFSLSFPGNDPVPEDGLGLSYDIHAQVMYGNQMSDESYLGNDISYGIGGRVYQRKGKWIVAPLIRGFGAGTYPGGQAPQINYDLLKMTIDGSDWNSTVEAELDYKPTDVVIYYGDYRAYVPVD